MRRECLFGKEIKYEKMRARREEGNDNNREDGGVVLVFGTDKRESLLT